MQGRPLRFLGLVIGGWTMARLIMLWPSADLAPALAEMSAPQTAFVVTTPKPAVAVCRVRMHSYNGGSVSTGASTMATAEPSPRQPGIENVGQSVAPTAGASQSSTPIGTIPILAGLPSGVPPRRARSWSGSFWLVARGGGGTGTAFTGPQLGGSQAGLRLAYALDRHRRLAIAARIAAPLGSGEREAAIGLEWRPTKLPVRIVAEQRFALNQGRGGPTVGMVGGAGPAPIGHKLVIEGYAQAGYIARGGDSEAFGDGAIRLSHPLADLGGVKFDLGASAWGAAQRGARRLDVGPSMAARMRIAHQPVRLSLEWRQRVAGNAAPASGPALSLGMDF